MDEEPKNFTVGGGARWFEKKRISSMTQQRAKRAAVRCLLPKDGRPSSSSSIRNDVSLLGAPAASLPIHCRPTAAADENLRLFFPDS